MKKFFGILLVILAVFIAGSCSQPMAAEVAGAEEKGIIGNGKEIIAYFCDWSIYAGHELYDPGKMPFEKLSIINFSFTALYDPTKPLLNDFKTYTEATFGRTVQKYAVSWMDKNADIDKTFGRVPWGSEYAGVLGQLKYYKEQHPHLKVVPSVGGWTKGHLFDEMAASASARAYFVESAIAFIREYKMDGVDIDWEYPGIHRLPDPNDPYDWGCPGSPAGKQNFTLLMKDLRQGLDAAGVEDNKTYILTAAVGIGYDKVAMTELDKYPQYMDYINLMTYDMHGGWESVTGHQAPIKPPTNGPYTQPIIDYYNVDYAIKQFTDAGVAASKLTLGLPFYSRGWGAVEVGNDANLPGLYESGSSSLAGKWGPGGQGPYFDVKDKIAAGTLTAYYDPVAQASYAYGAGNKEFYTFDTKAVIEQKAQMVKNLGLGGAMIWEIDGDTWKDGTYELTNAVYDILYNGVVPTPVPTATPTNTPDPNVTATPTPVAPACTLPEYVHGNVYTGGTKVHYNGHDWNAKWWTQNEAPSATGSGVWEDLGACGTVNPTPTATTVPATATPTTVPATATPTTVPATPTATSVPATATPTTVPATPTATSGTGAPAWSSTGVYNASDVVSHAGREWTAQWWTTGEEPGTTGEWGVWR